MEKTLTDAWLAGDNKADLDQLHKNNGSYESWNDAHCVAHKLKQVGMDKESTRYLQLKGYL